MGGGRIMINDYRIIKQIAGSKIQTFLQQTLSYSFLAERPLEVLPPGTIPFSIGDIQINSCKFIKWPYLSP